MRISSVNLAEVMSTLANRAASRSDLEALVKDLSLDVVPFDS